MCNRDFDPSKRSPGLNRRYALQLMLGGASATLFPSMSLAQNPPRPPGKLPPGKLGQSQGVVRWNQSTISIGTGFVGGLHLDGMAISAYNVGGLRGVIAATDLYSDSFVLQTLDSGTFAFGPVALPALNMAVALINDYQNVIVVYRDQDGLLNSTKVPIGGVAASNLLVVEDDLLVFVRQDNVVIGIRWTSPTEWQTVIGFGPVGPGGISGAHLQAINANSFLYIVPQNTGNSMAYYTSRNGLIVPAFESEFATGPFCLAPPYFYCLADDGTYWAITQNRLDNDPNFEPWPYPTIVSDSVQVGDPVLYGGVVYLGASNSNLYSVDVNTGALGPTIATAAPLDSLPLYLENGAVYFCSPTGQAYGIDLASQGASSALYDFKVDGSSLIGTENGVCMVLNNQGLTGVDLASELRGYSCDSVLMAEDYVSNGSGGYMPAIPAYRTTVQLVDGNKNPRANINVRIETTDTVTIVSGGATYALEQGDAVWLTTDIGGNLDFVSQADDIQSPALYLWASFMDANEAIVIYPDHNTLSQLTAKQGSDYQNATGFDGKPILPSGTDSNAVASTVQNILGGGVGSVSAGSNPYSAFPATTTNMTYQSTKGATGRPFNRGSSVTFYTNFGEDGSVTFSPGTPSLQGQLLGLSLEDFKNDVVKAGKKIKQIAVNVADTVSHLITTIDNAVYNFVINTLEDAVSVITGLFKTIFTDISKAVEWLSSVFDWTAIKQNHAAIKGMITVFQQKVRAYLTTATDDLKTKLHAFFQSAEDDVKTYIANIDAAIGTLSFGSQQPNGNDPKQLFGSNGSYAQSRSMHSKLQDNAKNASSPIIPTTLPLTVSDAFNKVKTLFETQIPAALQPIADDLTQAIDDFIGNFKKLFSNPMAFVLQTFHDLLSIVGDLAVLGLQAIDLCFELVIDLIADLLDTTVSALTGTFQIPILSDLFKLIFGTELTLLDLVAWIVAVPVTIIQKVSGAASGLVGQNEIQLVAWGVSAFIGCVVDALNDALDFDPADPIAWIDMSFALLTMGLSIPTDFNFDHDNASIVYFAFGICPILISFANSINGTVINPLPRSEPQQAEADAFNIQCYNATFVYGWAMLLFAYIAYLRDPSNFAGPNNATLKQNIFSNVGYMAKILEFNARPATVLADFVCPTTAMFIGLTAQGN